MSSFVVRSSVADYEIYVARGALDDALAEPFAAAVIDERFVTDVEWPALALVPIKAAEDRKTLASCEELIVALRQLGVARGETVLAVGGGLVQDLVTLTASLYMRGIPWCYAPTTLMAMVDSCVGGKSSINVGGHKNLVGNIYPPRSVYVDTGFIDGLDPIQVACGLCEAVKIAYCGGAGAFKTFLDLYSNDWLAGRRESLVESTLLTKRRFIEADEFDRGERRLLNFGHTFGHALESATKFGIPHGVAVGVGMIAAVQLAEAIDSASDEAAALKAYCLELLAPLGLGRAACDFDRERFEQALLADKKHNRTELRLIVPVPDGGVAEQSFTRNAESMAVLQSAMDQAWELLR